MLHFGDRTGYRVEHLRLPCAALARPLTLLHLSDTHLCVDDEAKLRFLRHVTDADYDFVCLTGDIAEQAEAEPLVPGLLSRRARHGSYAVFGNHDHVRQSVWVSLREVLARGADPAGERRDPDAMQAAFEAGGRWKVLRNEVVLHDIDGVRVLIAGIDDPYTGHADLEAAMATAPAADVRIALVHVPTGLAGFAAHGFDLVLAGHTHGGQIRLPGLGALATQCDLPRALARGLHAQGGMAVHVSAGLGAGRLIRARFRCPPTAYVLTLGGT